VPTIVVTRPTKTQPCPREIPDRPDPRSQQGNTAEEKFYRSVKPPGTMRKRIMIQPAGSLHFSTEISGISSGVAIAADSSNPVTVLSIRIDHSLALAETTIECDGHTLAVAFQLDYPLDFPHHVCTDDVTFSKTGPGGGFVSIVYLPFNINETGGEVVPTSIPFTLTHSFTFGELTIALILIPLVIVVTYQTIIAAFRKPIVRHK